MIRMKNSGVEWIGEIPENWEVKKLKYICEPLASGGTPDSNNDQYYCENGINWVAINDMSLVDYVENTAKHITNLAINEKKLKIYHKGTIIYSIYATLDHVAELSKPACINQALLALSIKDKSFNKSYFKYSLNAMKEYVLAFSSGNTQFNLNAQKVRNFTLLTPSFETQQRIATYLDKKCNKIEETIQNQQQVIEKLKAYKQSLITEAVTGKIKIQNGKVCGKYESYKDSGVEWIGKIPSGWISTRVGHLYKSMLGKMVCPNQLTEEHSLQKYLCAMNVHFDGVDLSEIKEMWFTPNEMNQYQVRNGDLLVVEGGAGAGGASIVYGLSENDKIFIQNSIHLVKPVKTNYLPKYLYYWIYSLVKQNYIDYTCNKATIPHFTKEKLEGMPIAISDKITQQEVIVYLDKKCTVIDTTIEQKKN